MRQLYLIIVVIFGSGVNSATYRGAYPSEVPSYPKRTSFPMTLYGPGTGTLKGGGYRWTNDNPWKRISEATRENLSLTKKCDGKQNLVDDFGLVSFIIGTLSTFVGFGLDLIVTFTGNTIAIVALVLTLIFGIPNFLISLFGLSGQTIYFIANGLNVLGFAIAYFGASSLEVGNLGLLTDIVFEILGFVGFVMSIFSTWPHLIDEVVLLSRAADSGFGFQVKHFVDTYGCHQGTLY